MCFSSNKHIFHFPAEGMVADVVFYILLFSQALFILKPHSFVQCTFAYFFLSNAQTVHVYWFLVLRWGFSDFLKIKTFATI